jgi:hypothetical protein
MSSQNLPPRSPIPVSSAISTVLLSSRKESKISTIAVKSDDFQKDHFIPVWNKIPFSSSTSCSIETPKIIDYLKVKPSFFSESNRLKMIEQTQVWIPFSCSETERKKKNGESSQMRQDILIRNFSSSSSAREQEKDEDLFLNVTTASAAGLWIRIHCGWIQATSCKEIFCLPQSCFGNLFSPSPSSSTKKNSRQNFPSHLIGTTLIRWRNRSSNNKKVPIFTSPNSSSFVVGELSPNECIVGTGRLHHHHHRQAVVAINRNNNFGLVDSLASTLNSTTIDFGIDEQKTKKILLVMTFVECLMPSRILRRSQQNQRNESQKNQRQFVFLPIGNGKDEAWICPELFLPGLNTAAASLPPAWRVVVNPFSSNIMNEEKTQKHQKTKSSSTREPTTFDDEEQETKVQEQNSAVTCLNFSLGNISPQQMMNYNINQNNKEKSSRDVSPLPRSQMMECSASARTPREFLVTQKFSPAGNDDNNDDDENFQSIISGGKNTKQRQHHRDCFENVE